MVSKGGDYWKRTLRLPKTSFPLRPAAEDRTRYLQRCTDDLYAWQACSRAHRKPFILHDGPPYANGKLHIGHALNKILKDLILRTKIQQGHRVVYRPGWDCHGLPIEIKATQALRWAHGQRPKQEQSAPFEPDAVETRQHARALAAAAVESQKAEFRSWAVLGDWDHSWHTMDKQYGTKQLAVFQTMVAKGLIYRQFKPVHWSSSSRTALAEAELIKEDATLKAAFVMFPLTAIPPALDAKVPGLRNLSIVIWTTLPWTLPANRAVLMHRDMDYVIVRFRTDDLVVASKRLPYLQEHVFKQEPWSLISNSIKGHDLIGATYVNPLHGLDSEPRPVIHADYVTDDTGTGVVHAAPGHGADDYKTCRALGIEAWAPVDDQGRFTSDVLPGNPNASALAGLEVLDEGNGVVLSLLGRHLLQAHKHKRQRLLDWRTKQPTFERATAQWFADVASIKEDALARLEDVKFIPESGRARLRSFVDRRGEWCISRQRPWGLPIPALFDAQGAAVLNDTVVDHVKRELEKKSGDAWWTDAPEDPSWVPGDLHGHLRRGRDTMDVWFDSGTSWTQMPKDVEQADLYVEGSDQHRGWFQSSLLTHTAASASPKAPYKMVITHGFTLDEHGRKMSKSEGNVTNPQDFIRGTNLAKIKQGKAKHMNSAGDRGLGVDALRLWVASSDYTKDVSVGVAVEEAIYKSLNKYRITLKMLLGTITPAARTLPISYLDQMALVQLHRVMKEVHTAYENFEFYKAVHEINRWINNDLSAFYLDALKDRLYCGDGGGVLEEILTGLLRMLSPITPSLVEEAWAHRPAWMQDEEQPATVGESTAPPPSNPFLQPLTAPVLHPDRIKTRLSLHEELELMTARVERIMTIKAGVNQALEHGRRRGTIKVAAKTRATLHLRDAADRELLDRVAAELPTIFGVSAVQIRLFDPADPPPMPTKALPPGSSSAWVFAADFDAPALSSSSATSSFSSPSSSTPSSPSSSPTASINGGGGGGTAIIQPAEFDTRCERCWRFVATSEDGVCARCEHVVAGMEMEMGEEGKGEGEGDAFTGERTKG